MTFIEEFKKRGYFYQCSNLDLLTDISKNGKIVAYIGFDCTAKSLHVGNLMQIMILRLLQQCGHKPIILIGGGTTKVGDPSGKEEMRKLLSERDIENNISGIKKSLSKFITFGTGPSDAIMLNNDSWLKELNYIDFLRDYGKLFSINRMLTMESVRARLDREQSLTFLEFNYMLLQAYDYYFLNKNHGCMLQLGGSDQWGNIITGVDLIRKTSGQEVFALTTPLLTTASGVKMGKSVGGAVWINEDLLSPYDYYQYWRNVEDADVVRFAKLYAEFSDPELEQFERLAGDKINEAKKKLAYTLTKLCHGQENADLAIDTATKVFEQGTVGEDMPTVYISSKRINLGITCHELLFETELAVSKGDARRLIRGKGVKINDKTVTDENSIINNDYVNNSLIKLSLGKKRHILVKLSDDTINS